MRKGILAMTNYNERLDEILERYAEAIGSYVNFGSPFNSDEDNIAGAEALYQTSQNEIKQAITSLIKELVAEAKPRHLSDISGYHVDFTPDQLTRITAANRASNEAVKKFEQNLLKALEEV